MWPSLCSAAWGVWISCLSSLLSCILEDSIFISNCSSFLKMWASHALPALWPLSPSSSYTVSFLTNSSGFFINLAHGAPAHSPHRSREDKITFPQLCFHAYFAISELSISLKKYLILKHIKDIDRCKTLNHQHLAKRVSKPLSSNNFVSSPLVLQIHPSLCYFFKSFSDNCVFIK